MYVVYLPKRKGENVKDRKLNQFLKFYMERTSEEYSIISSPGYLSKSSSKINDYLYELKEILNKRGNRNIRIGFLNGMNGHYDVGYGASIIDEYNNLLPMHDFVQIPLKINQAIDHRKMMCFFTFKDNSVESILSKELTLKDVDSFLERIHIGAILIGSSNQSYATYFEKYAPKGEADVFMYDDSDDKSMNEWTNWLSNVGPENDFRALLNDIVITKSIAGTGHENTQEFFKKILKDMLMSGLEK